MLGAELVGVYAAGSVGLGAYQPGRSDIDVAIVCENPLDEQTKRDLVGRLRHENLPCPARGLELVVYTSAIAAAGNADPGFEVELNSGRAMAFRATYAGDLRDPADGLFWYAIDRSILHSHGLVLAGPPAAQVFADIHEDGLTALLRASLRWWLALPAAADTSDSEPAHGFEDAVLGACRALVRVRTGRWRSKVAAGEELAADGYHRALLTQCVAARAGGTPPSAAAARAFQREVLEEIS